MSHIFNQYILANHIIRQSGYDLYQAHPVNEPTHSVALKIFDAERLIPAATLDDFQQMERRLQFLKHPHIVAVLGLGIEQGKPYIVSEYLAGGSLRQYLDHYSPHQLALHEAVGVVMQIGLAVAFAHIYQIFHQDIRPENILLDEQGKVHLTNFTLQNIIDETQSAHKSDHRTPNYQPSEQLARVARDQYALGCLLYELTTGTLPFSTTNLFSPWQSSILALPAPSTLVPTLPRALETVILRALAPQPEDRYADVATFLAELKTALPLPAQTLSLTHQMGDYQYQPAPGESEQKSFPLLTPLSLPIQHQDNLSDLPPSLLSPNTPQLPTNESVPADPPEIQSEKDTQIVSGNTQAVVESTLMATRNTFIAPRATKWKWPIALLAVVLAVLIIAVLFIQRANPTTVKTVNTTSFTMPLVVAQKTTPQSVKLTPQTTVQPIATPVSSAQTTNRLTPTPTATPIPTPTATTTNVARNATVTSSSSEPNAGWSLANVHDGQRAETNSSPGWSSNGNIVANHSETLQFDFGSKQYIDEMDVYICTNNGTTGYGMPTNFTIDVSNDAQNWTTVVTRTNYPAPTTAALQIFSFSLQNVRYIRIVGTSLRQSSGDRNLYRMQFAEVEVY